jgi:PHD/YefM family antitoxin component YafN of YafNO toxin-antitoxin module
VGESRDGRTGRAGFRDRLAERAMRSKLARQLEGRAPLTSRRFVIGLYFAGPAVDLYQVRQWYEPLLELSRSWPVVILSRDASASSVLLDESPVPVAYLAADRDLDAFVEAHPLRVVLYAGHDAGNFAMLGHGRRWHVFIGHGESDRADAVTNHVKVYDYDLVAGDAAIDRLHRALWDYDVPARAIPIGRPQADHCAGSVPYPADDRTVVLYAPTWEGECPAESYGSLVSHGRALVREVLASGAHRLVYRPHPRTGTLDAGHEAAHREVVAAIAAANRADPDAHHLHDTDAQLDWQLATADAAIVDVSALVYDRLATGRPVLVTRPAHPDAVIDTAGYLADCEWLVATDASRVLERVEGLSADTAATVRRRRWVEHYFGDTATGVATRRFRAAIEALLGEWERHSALHARDGLSDGTLRAAAEDDVLR